jgi:hypothetical protein
MAISMVGTHRRGVRPSDAKYLSVLLRGLFSDRCLTSRNRFLNCVVEMEPTLTQTVHRSAS